MQTHKRGSELSLRELRHFGLVFAALLVGVFGLVLPWLFNHPWPTWPWLVAICEGSLALLAPGALRKPYDGWQRLGMLLGRVSSAIILTLLFVLVLTPVGLLLRTFGRQPLGRRSPVGTDSYFEDSEARDIKHMERPF